MQWPVCQNSEVSPALTVCATHRRASGSDREPRVSALIVHRIPDVLLAAAPDATLNSLPSLNPTFELFYPGAKVGALLSDRIEADLENS